MTSQEYEQIVRRMRPQLLKLGYSFFSDQEMAADAAQEALLRFWLLREQVADSSHAEALLVRITKNVCVSEWRRKQKMGFLPTLETGNILAEEMQPMADDDNARLLASAIQSLTPTEQRLFRMRHELEMDIPQISAVTGLLPRSVSQVVSVARRKIMEKLKKGG
ncbi:MAG: sigma-70 family RNA polymerase sigma factor, partial [Prevotella sp.]|nr:sigma-70 family RNA polymerase sigma factor [Prevotella sp.]